MGGQGSQGGLNVAVFLVRTLPFFSCLVVMSRAIDTIFWFKQNAVVAGLRGTSSALCPRLRQAACSLALA